MAGEHGERQSDEMEQIGPAQVLSMAEKLGLTLDGVAIEKLLREARMIFGSRRNADETTLFAEVVAEKLRRIGQESSKSTRFVAAFRQAHDLYASFGDAANSGFYYLESLDKLGSAIESFNRVARRSGCKDAVDYFNQLAERYQSISDKLKPALESGRRKVFIVLGIGQHARIVEGDFRINKDGKITVSYKEPQKRKGTPVEKLITVGLGLVFLTEKEASESIRK